MHRRRWGEREWDRVVGQVRKGRCTPFLGAGACVPTLPTGDALGRELAGEWDYPFGEPVTLHEVAQFVSVMESDPVVVKERVAERLGRVRDPDFSDPTQIHTLLAAHPISVFLTTNYDDYMTRALQLAGKDPVTAICPWYSTADHDEFTQLSSDYRPRPEEPLVYHLHGRLRPPASIVLAEQDYVEFLVNLGRDISQDDRRVVPVHILPALTRDPLLFIGYSLRDWSFRMLFHGIVAAEPLVMKRRHISVQLAPDLPADDATQARAMEFLNLYFDQLNISVFWGEASEFCAELSRRLGTS